MLIGNCCEQIYSCNLGLDMVMNQKCLVLILIYKITTVICVLIKEHFNDAKCEYCKIVYSWVTYFDIVMIQ